MTFLCTMNSLRDPALYLVWAARDTGRGGSREPGTVGKRSRRRFEDVGNAAGQNEPTLVNDDFSLVL